MDATNETRHLLAIAPTPDLDGSISRNANVFRYAIVRAAALDTLIGRHPGVWRWPASRDARAGTDLSRSEFSAAFRECVRSGRLKEMRHPHGTVNVLRMPSYGFTGHDLATRTAARYVFTAILLAIPYGRSDLRTTVSDLLLWSGYATPRTITRALAELATAGLLTYATESGTDGTQHVRIRLPLHELQPFMRAPTAPNNARWAHRGH